MNPNELKPEEIKAIRLNLGLSQEDFAHIVGVRLATVSRWENGLFKPSYLALEKIKTLVKPDKTYRMKKEKAA